MLSSYSVTWTFARDESIKLIRARGGTIPTTSVTFYGADTMRVSLAALFSDAAEPAKDLRGNSPMLMQRLMRFENADRKLFRLRDGNNRAGNYDEPRGVRLNDDEEEEAGRRSSRFVIFTSVTAAAGARRFSTREWRTRKGERECEKQFIRTRECNGNLQ